ncbi:MAG: coproporphyrinogen dehydrogenase HemZ [Hydrogenoanaerobacterium sp.]
MKLYIFGHDYKYEVEALVRMFFHGVSIDVITGEPPNNEAENYVYTKAVRGGQSTALFVKAQLAGRTAEKSAELLNASHSFDAECERVFAVLLYDILTPLTGVKLSWGVLTGIRPVKFVHKFHSEGKTDDEIRDILEKKYLVTPQKTELLLQTAAKEAKVLSLSLPQSFSLYISIPFCPSRCNYCSFVSHDIEKAGKLVPQYVELLIKEIAYTAELVKKMGLRLETIYFGGGTPTTLTAKQLLDVMRAVSDGFDLSNLREYTVEAGRPDTITKEKLEAIKQMGATRISINPQTMNDSVLEAIGRRHTALQTVQAMSLARAVGHKSINMDIIAGLPTDSYESFCDTMEKVIELSPENITLHTLTVKRAATLTDDNSTEYKKQSAVVAKMLNYAAMRFKAEGYSPYYLYRQKNTVDNMENVGYCKDGHEGLYNVFIMDEAHSIIALGAGGVSKLRSPHSELINRIFNYKFPYEYISRFDEILHRKDKISEFYVKNPL